MKTPGLLSERPMSSWWFTKKKKKTSLCGVFMFHSHRRDLVCLEVFFLPPRRRFSPTTRQLLSFDVIPAWQSSQESHAHFVFQSEFNAKNFPALKTQIFPSCYCQGEFSFTVSTLAS